MRVEHVQRHLDGIEMEAMVTGDLQRVEVDGRVLVSREADVSDLAGLPRVFERPMGAIFFEDPSGSSNLMTS